jgi:hypothetical protein
MLMLMLLLMLVVLTQQSRKSPTQHQRPPWPAHAASLIPTLLAEIQLPSPFRRMLSVLVARTLQTSMWPGERR